MEVLGNIDVDGAAQLLRSLGAAWLALTFDGKLIRVQEGCFQGSEVSENRAQQRHKQEVNGIETEVFCLKSSRARSQ